MRNASLILLILAMSAGLYARWGHKQKHQVRPQETDQTFRSLNHDTLSSPILHYLHLKKVELEEDEIKYPNLQKSIKVVENEINDLERDAYTKPYLGRDFIDKFNSVHFDLQRLWELELDYVV